MGKVQADIVQMSADATAFHTAIAGTNAAFQSAKSSALAQLKTDLAAKASGTVLAGDRLALKNAVTTHTAGLKADVAQWKSTHQTDVHRLHADLVALHAKPPPISLA